MHRGGSRSQFRILVALAVVLIVVGCGDDEEMKVIPDPIVVTDESVAGPGPGVFYHLAVTHESNVRPLLQQALDRGVVIAFAWQPNQPSPCADPSAREALVLQVKGDSSGLTGLGFVDDPTPWVPNCGITEFLEYRF